jgi:thiol-disulfide isomerase/thioredoxin
MRTLARIFLLFLLAALCVLLAAGCSAWARAHAPPLEWSTAIQWEDYERGIERAKEERKPVLLVFYADWCKPCKEYHRHVFEDARVIERAKDFVMVRVNGDKREDLYKRFMPDGDYLPRTMFFTADGVLLKGVPIGVWGRRFQYNPKDPKSLLGGMELALKFARDPDLSPGKDPSTITTAAVCATKPTDTTCVSCNKAKCCDDMLAFFNGGVAAYAPLRICSSARCAELCPEEMETSSTRGHHEESPATQRLP